MREDTRAAIRAYRAADKAAAEAVKRYVEIDAKSWLDRSLRPERQRALKAIKPAQEKAEALYREIAQCALREAGE